MAIFKKEVSAEELKELTQEELEQVDGGTIELTDSIVSDANGPCGTKTHYYVYDNYGKLWSRCTSLDAAIRVCEKRGYSTEIVDHRTLQDWSPS